MSTIAVRNHTGTIKTKVFRWWLEHDVAKQAAADAAMVNRCLISNPFLAKRKNDKTGDIGSEAAFAQWAEPLLNSEAFRREGYKQPKQSTLVARIKNLVEGRIKVLKKGSKTGSVQVHIHMHNAKHPYGWCRCPAQKSPLLIQRSPCS